MQKMDRLIAKSALGGKITWFALLYFGTLATWVEIRGKVGNVWWCYVVLAMCSVIVTYLWADSFNVGGKEMTKEQARQALKDALFEKQQADDGFQKVKGPIIYSGPVPDAQPLPQPERPPTADDLVKMSEALKRCEKAAKNLDKALSNYRRYAL